MTDLTKDNNRFYKGIAQMGWMPIHDKLHTEPVCTIPIDTRTFYADLLLKLLNDWWDTQATMVQACYECGFVVKTRGEEFLHCPICEGRLATTFWEKTVNATD